MARILSADAAKLIGERITLCGWVNARRDLGKITFIDLRDRKGIIQVVFVPSELDEDSKKSVGDLRPEYVITIEGVVQERNEKNKNPNLATGNVEILAKNLKILNASETPPFEVDKDTRGVNEELRLKYRYLDLRSERMAKNIKKRHQAITYMREFLNACDFIEIATPILTKSTPEGARDFIVPSRLHAGEFYALPQSPQQYKQLLMVAGMERYYQVALCLRDEDARADRSPGEFYQLDMEMSFVQQDEIMDLVEELMLGLVKKVFPDKKLTFDKFPRLTWEECMKKYKSDKPDLRTNKENPQELAFTWVVDWPLFEPEKENGHFAPAHHMFTRPKDEDITMLDKNPERVKSYQMDLVLNGFEVGGGGLRIHDPAMQTKIFDLIGFSKSDKEYFNHMLEAFRYGAPPHGGIASGIDRLLMALIGEESLREAIAFPKTGDARDLTVGAPSPISKEQLDEAHISIKKGKK
ncbi:MAG: aspartate--tRNA ligase [Patescibacteria group bacterium]|nr:aspartate--tRNA ligase [Patescibacteria group bacterium]